MATITKKNGKHQVQIRKGRPALPLQVFYVSCRCAAMGFKDREWSLNEVSSLHTLSPNAEFDDLADRYAATIIPQFKSAEREASRLKVDASDGLGRRHA